MNVCMNNFNVNNINKIKHSFFSLVYKLKVEEKKNINKNGYTMKPWLVKDSSLNSSIKQIYILF